MGIKDSAPRRHEGLGVREVRVRRRRRVHSVAIPPRHTGELVHDSLRQSLDWRGHGRGVSRMVDPSRGPLYKVVSM